MTDDVTAKERIGGSDNLVMQDFYVEWDMKHAQILN